MAERQYGAVFGSTQIRFVSHDTTSSPIADVDISSYNFDIYEASISERLFKMLTVHENTTWSQGNLHLIEILPLIGILGGNTSKTVASSGTLPSVQIGRTASSAH
jgi:hypothetical protein